MRCSIGEWLTQARVWALDGGGGGGRQPKGPKQPKKTKGTAHKNTAAVPKTWAKSGGRPENKMADYIADYQFQFLKIHALAAACAVH